MCVYTLLFPFYSFFNFIQGLAIYPWLALNSSSSCLSFLSAGITGVHYWAWPCMHAFAMDYVLYKAFLIIRAFITMLVLGARKASLVFSSSHRWLGMGDGRQEDSSKA